MEDKDYCCYCEEETGYSEGYMIWETFDGKWGHEWCVKKYDEKNKTKKMKMEDEIKKLEGKIRGLDYEKQKIQSEIEKLKAELINIED
jgi:hypothetical protein